MSEEIVILRDETLKVALEKAKELAKDARPYDVPVLSCLTSFISVLAHLH